MGTWWNERYKLWKAFVLWDSRKRWDHIQEHYNTKNIHWESTEHTEISHWRYNFYVLGSQHVQTAIYALLEYLMNFVVQWVYILIYAGSILWVARVMPQILLTWWSYHPVICHLSYVSFPASQALPRNMLITADFPQSGTIYITSLNDHSPVRFGVIYITFCSLKWGHEPCMTDIGELFQSYSEHCNVDDHPRNFHYLSTIFRALSVVVYRVSQHVNLSIFIKHPVTLGMFVLTDCSS